jgi:ACR3 family arsenite efflux pump ArsB
MAVVLIIVCAFFLFLCVQVISGVSGTAVSFWPVAKSVLLFLGVPLLAGRTMCECCSRIVLLLACMLD